MHKSKKANNAFSTCWLSSHTIRSSKIR